MGPSDDVSIEIRTTGLSGAGCAIETVRDAVRSDDRKVLPGAVETDATDASCSATPREALKDAAALCSAPLDGSCTRA